jgi:hypothetical protein
MVSVALQTDFLSKIATNLLEEIDAFILSAAFKESKGQLG